MADDYVDPLEGMFLPEPEQDTSMSPGEFVTQGASKIPAGLDWLNTNFNPAQIAYDSGQQLAQSFEDGSVLGGVLGGASLAGALIPGMPKIRTRGAFKGSPVNDPIKKGFRQRVAYPDVYKSGQQLAEEAAKRVAPEDPALANVFGVTRDDLFNINQGGARAGTTDPTDVINFKAGKGSKHVEGLTTNANAQRLRDSIGAFREGAPEMYKGMASWYTMDPLYSRFVDEFGEQMAPAMFNRFQAATGMHSPASTVVDELTRGSAANMAAQRGIYGDYLDVGGLPRGKPGKAGSAFEFVPGHLAHSTSQAPVFGQYLDHGNLSFMTSPKVPAYIAAAGVDAPGVPFQTSAAVPDAHWGRAVGLPDVRPSSTAVGESAKLPEYKPLMPWFRDKVAAPEGLEAVPAQAILWGGYAPQTGVKSKVAAPKLELLAGLVQNNADLKGKTASDMLTDIITGRDYLRKR